jgi:hypothetical protein
MAMDINYVSKAWRWEIKLLRNISTQISLLRNHIHANAPGGGGRRHAVNNLSVILLLEWHGNACLPGDAE